MRPKGISVQCFKCSQDYEAEEAGVILFCSHSYTALVSWVSEHLLVRNKRVITSAYDSFSITLLMEGGKKEKP